MPLHCLFYASDTYSVLVKDKNIYGTKMLPLPSPTFVVFYNGKQELLREQVQKNLEKGYSKEMIADFLGIDEEMIAEIMNDGLIKASQK